eukprot:3361931-Rhodomonas_salina.1
MSPMYCRGSGDVTHPKHVIAPARTRVDEVQTADTHVGQSSGVRVPLQAQPPDMHTPRAHTRIAHQRTCVPSPSRPPASCRPSHAHTLDDTCTVTHVPPTPHNPPTSTLAP